MARISDEVIEQLKNEVSLVRLMESQGFALKKKGHDYVCRCPFHEDKTPSLVVTPVKNLFHCFGCDVGGSVIDWVIKREGISFRRAVEILQQDSGLVAEQNQSGKKRAKTSRPQALPSELTATSNDQALLKRVITFYHETLKQSPEAMDYLASRGLNNEELIDTFQLGFANRTLAYRLPPKIQPEGTAIRGKLQEIGLFRKSGHEHFNGSIVVPVLNENNQIKEVYGRKIGNRLRKGTPSHLYLPGEHQGVWNIASLAAHDEIILCESLIDAMTFWVNDFKNVTASYGTSGFTAEHLTAFKQHHIKRVLIAYDRDEAGNTAAKKLAEKLNAEGIDCYRVLFPKNMDANEYALKMSPPRKSLELVIRKAEPMLKAKSRASSGELRVKDKKKTEKSADKTKPEIKPVVPALPASPIPSVTSLDIEAEVTEQEVIMMLGSRRYRVRGLNKNLSYEQLKINLCVMSMDGRYADVPGGSTSVSDGDCMHLDTLELYQAKQRQSFIKQAAIELRVSEPVIKKDLSKVLLKLEQLQDDNIQSTLKPKEKTVTLTDEEQIKALDLLRSPDLLDRILNDFNRAGVVGEQTNKLVGYLAAVSRKLDNPLAVIIQSTSAAGKSALMNAVLAMVPEEEKIQYSAMTGQSLFYMGETNLKHKILAIAEEEGAENASYALKLLQSEGELTMASTGKDNEGNLTTQEYHVEGPVMLFSTTTAIDLDEELMNRCLVLTVNESREQTQQIHQMQRRKRTMAGLEDKAEKKRILAIHKNAQRLIKPLQIMNPYADQLTFLNDQTRTRRDHEKYLTLIDSIALLHQHQREIKTKTFEGESFEYVEVTLADIKIANDLAHKVLGRSLDELPPQTRNLLKQIQKIVFEVCQQNDIQQTDYRFSRRTIREQTGWSDSQLKNHCKRLEEMEYLLVHRGSRGHSIEYELLYTSTSHNDEPQLMGLIDVENLIYDDQKSGQKELKSAPSLGQVTPKSGLSLASENPAKPETIESKSKKPKINGKTHSTGRKTRPLSRSRSVIAERM